MSDTLRAHIAAIEASLELLKVQIAGLRHHVEMQSAAKGARLDIPERCSGIEPRACALQHDESRIEFGSFADPHRWKCQGCGYDSAGEGSASH